MGIHIKKHSVTLFLYVVSCPLAPPTSMGIIAYGLKTGANIHSFFEISLFFREKLMKNYIISYRIASGEWTSFCIKLTNTNTT